MHASPHSPQRLRRLAAMGIDVYVRRELLPARADAPPELPTPTSAVRPDEAAMRAALDVEPPTVPERAKVSLAGARAVLEDGQPPAEVPAAAGSAGTEGPEAVAAAPQEVAEPADLGRTTVPGGEVPRFRLTALRAGSGLLLVDEALLPYERREVLARLGDLLRAALLARAAQGARSAPAKGMETQAFFWPQVEADHIDQSLPRAVEALGAWVRRCTGDGEGCLVVVTTTPDAPAAAPLGALEALPVRRARIDASFVTAPDADAHRAAWRALSALAAGDAPP